METEDQANTPPPAEEGSPNTSAPKKMSAEEGGHFPPYTIKHSFFNQPKQDNPHPTQRKKRRRDLSLPVDLKVRLVNTQHKNYYGTEHFPSWDMSHIGRTCPTFYVHAWKNGLKLAIMYTDKGSDTEDDKAKDPTNEDSEDDGDDDEEEESPSDFTDYGTILGASMREKDDKLVTQMKDKILAKLTKYKEYSLHQYGKHA